MDEEQADVLGRVLELTKLRGRIFCRTTARAPWGLRFDATGEAVFHLVTDGSCWLFANGEKRQLSAGDIVMLPRGAGHAVADRPGSRRIPLQEWLSRSAPGSADRALGDEGGAPTRVLCGTYSFDVIGPRHPVLRLLPETLYLSGETCRARTDLSATVAALTGEHARATSGSSLVVSRLLDVLFVQIVRAWAEGQPPGGAGWLGALGDSTMARALALMHAEVARPWDVATLARAAGTSRATLTRRFAAEIGEPPVAYLARLRMQEAARRLVTSDESVAAVAHAVGYASEFAFNRAFRRELGEPPGEYRRRAAHRVGA